MKPNHKTFSFTILLAALLFSKVAFGVVAYPYPIEYSLPDGSKLTIVLRGDEKVKWAETVDGYSILLNEKGFYEYAITNEYGDMVRSGVQVSNEMKRTSIESQLLSKMPKGIRFSKSQVSLMKQIWEINKSEAAKVFPTNGERKLICILIGFTDLPFTKTQADFNNLFNQVGYSAGGASGSVKDYYLENSYGQFNLTVDVAGPYTASQNMLYYGGNDASGNDLRPRELVREAIILANPDVNFADYDNDSNGYVDAVYIIYAGYGEEAGGGANAIWAHAWSLWPTETLDGKVISSYSCSAEHRGNSGTNITRIGVICHEFGHVLGAPDYYDTDYEDGGEFTGTGQWDMMAGGTWNNGGATPAHHNGFTKVIYYNWATVTELNSASTITLGNAVEHSNSFFRINTTTPNEYFFIENREKHKFDGYIPGSGMIIYHVHSQVFSDSYVINATHPQRMYIVSQNATIDPTSDPASYGNVNNASCAWTGVGKTEFSDASLPSSKSWAGENTEKPITNISRDAIAKTVTFDFMGGAQGNPIGFLANAVSVSQIDLSWDLNADNDPVIIAWSASAGFGTPEDGTVYTVGNTIPDGGTVLYSGTATSFDHTNLDVNTTYYYRIWSQLENDFYSPGAGASATTHCDMISSLPFDEDFNASTNTPDCWQIIDNQGNGQVWQFGTHTDGLVGTDGNYAFLNSDAYGSGQTQNADLITPLLDLSTYTNVILSFNHYYEHYTGSSAKLFYSINGGANWTQIQQWAANTTNPATFSQEIAALAGQSQVKFKWNYYGSWGYYWDVDNIQITGTEVALKTLSINTVGEGTVNVNGSNYTSPLSSAEGANISLNAIPSEGYQFEGWSGDLISTNPDESITMDTDKTITATFTVIPQYTLTLNLIGEGTVDVDGVEYTVPVTVYEGEELPLEAISAEGYLFSGWSGDLTSSNPIESITMDADKTIAVTFTEIPQYTLTLNLIGEGTVDVDGVEYTVPVTVYEGEELPLEAISAEGYLFSGWSGDLTSSNPIESITMDADKTITVTFTEIPQYTLTLNLIGEGTVDVDGVEYTVPVTVYEGEELPLEAISAEGYLFSGWSGDLTSTNPIETITMDADKTITATFTEIPQYTLTVSIVGEGEVEVDGLAYSSPVSVYQDSELILTATNSVGFQFDGWSGDLVSNNTTESVVMNSSKSITATFSSITNAGYGQISNIQIFPNPFTSTIYINNAEYARRVTVTNIIGQQLLDLSLKGDKVVTVKTDRLSKGIYLVTVYKVNGERQVRKLIKE